MFKKILMVLISSFIGIMASPEFLTASDHVAVTGLNDRDVVETVEIVETTEEPVVDTPVYTEPVAVSYASYVYTPANYIQIGGRTIEIVNAAYSDAESYNHVNKYGRLLYGHNSADVFGGLSSLGIGSTFSVTYGGATTNYVVSKAILFEKNFELGGALQLNGEGDYMNPIVEAYNYGQYDLTLMTCAGTMLGGGDATHRLVLFASAM